MNGYDDCIKDRALINCAKMAEIIVKNAKIADKKVCGKFPNPNNNGTVPQID